MMSRPPTPPMTIAVQHTDRSAALVNRSVSIENVTVAAVPPGNPGVLGVYHGALDAAEVPLARYISWKDHGEPVTAVPVFPDRLMLHQYIYARADAGIKSLTDLRGKRVVMPAYFITAAFWHRSFLREAGVDAKDVEWLTASQEAEPEHTAIIEKLGVKFAPGGNRLGLDHLLDGRADAVMTEGSLAIPTEKRNEVIRVIKDVDQVQRDWYSRTGFHPAVHVIVVRESSLKARPQLGEEICRAFDQARGHAYRQLQNDRMTSLPFIRGIVDEFTEHFSDDPWSYGAERNRAELDTLLGYAHDESYTSRRLRVDELFEPASAKYEFTSRMVTAGAIGG